MREKTFDDGDIIYREGALAEHGWKIVSGTVEVASAADGQRRTAESGELIGDEAASRAAVFAGTATARGIVILAPVPPHDIARAARQAPEEEPPESETPRSQRRRRKPPGERTARRPSGTKNLPALRPAPAVESATVPSAERARLKTSFFARLFGTDTEPGFARLEIRVASFAGGGGEERARQLAAALGGRKGLNPRAMKRQIWAEGDDLVVGRRNLAERVRGWLAGTGADVLIWAGPGDVGEDSGDGGDAPRYLHLVARVPGDAEAAGDGDGLFPLPFAGPGDEPAMSLLHAAVLTLGLGGDVSKRRTCARDLPLALQDAAAGLETAGRERALVQAVIGRGYAALAAVDRRADSLRTARTYLDEARGGVAKAGHAELTPFLDKDRAAVMQSLAERTNDADLLAESVPVIETVLDGFDRDVFPLHWAGLQHRLGVARLRLDFDTGDVDTLRQALAAFQAALGVFSRESTPLKWAETMSHLAQVAQILGEQLRNPEALMRAADALRQVLKVHTKRKRPLHWAATQNNLGTALFLLGKLTRRIEALEGAAEAFELAASLYRMRNAERMAALAERNLQHVRRLLASYRPAEPESDPWEAQFDDADGRGRASA